MSHPGPPSGPRLPPGGAPPLQPSGPGPRIRPPSGAPAGPDLSKLADPGAWKLWVALGLALFAGGLVVAGLGGLFAAKHMAILGNVLRIPGSVLLAIGVAVAAFEAEDLSGGVRLAAVIVSGFMALFIL